MAGRNWQLFPSIKGFYLENLGCAKNQVDAEEIIRALEDAGLEYLDQPESADLIIVNSCGFIDAAKQESLDFLLSYRAQYPGKKLVLAGCLAQRYGDQMDLPDIDAVFGNRVPADITAILPGLDRNERLVQISDRQFKLSGQRHLLGFKGSTYLKIAEGCSNNCSYCAIPLIRGSVQSRPLAEIKQEFTELVNRGIREINLIAQDLASYGLDTANTDDLVQLLQELCSVPGDFRIRLLYIHPDRFPSGLLALMRSEERIMHYFDIPVQHASPRILKAMGRVPDAAKNLDLFKQIRDNFDDAVIRSTFLLGFPGESAEDLEILLDFQQQAALEWLGSFIYSREEGTAAYDMASSRSLRKTARQALRYQKLIEERQVGLTASRLDRFVGTDMQLLVEELVPEEDLAICRAYAHAPDVDGAVVLHGSSFQPGDCIKARIGRRNGFDLEAFPFT